MQIFGGDLDTRKSATFHLMLMDQQVGTRSYRDVYSLQLQKVNTMH